MVLISIILSEFWSWFLQSVQANLGDSTSKSIYTASYPFTKFRVNL